MKIISLFNNKGGVGKSTLAYHLSCALSELGKKTLMIDLDPQCNLTLFGIEEEGLHSIWEKEDDFIEDFEDAYGKIDATAYKELLKTPRTIHFLLKPAEDGQGDLPYFPPPCSINPLLDLIPGRLTIHRFENKISERWSGAYQGDALAIRTITSIRQIAEEYARIYNYDFIIIDTSPSLGALNKVIISTVDGFIIPALPDMFSLYGIRNIGNSLSLWKREFETIYSLISTDKRKKFPNDFVRFLGYTIYNAKKYAGVTPWDLAKAHYHYAKQIPETIEKYIGDELRSHLTPEQVAEPIGHTAVMHTHNTLPNMAQKYKNPIWRIPELLGIEPSDRSTVVGNRGTYLATKDQYEIFARDVLERVQTLN